MKIKFITGLVLAATFMAVSPVNASNDGVSFKVQISGHVKTECTLQTNGIYEQLSEDVFRLGTIDRYCNTAHQLTLSHSAALSGGYITFEGSHIPLQNNASIVIADRGPASRTDDIIISGINAATARRIAGSLQLQISPRRL